MPPPAFGSRPREPFGDFYRGRRVWITGHTGFKGSWLSAWLVEMGALVTGYSLQPPSRPALFDELDLKKRVKDIRSDIRKADKVASEMAKANPEIVFHLAAQPIVRASYDDPLSTYATNVMGTVHVLDALGRQSGVRAAVIITSDKCYENVEQEAGYREDDRLGGKDPYSASKAGAEMAFSSYARSFFSVSGPAVASARAGNVIGGGDWAKDRIVPDCIRAWQRHQAPSVRNPSSTRPWQHVLEPLSGYLALAASLACVEKHSLLSAVRGRVRTGRNARTQNRMTKELLRGQSFNFGPRENVNETVGKLIRGLRSHWPGAKEPKIEKTYAKPEAGLLRLDCSKAKEWLGWQATLDFDETVAFTANWYREFCGRKEKAWDLTIDQIKKYMSLARMRRLPWAG